MGDKKFTLIELHLDGDTQFGPGTITSALPFGPGAEDEEEFETESATDTDDDAATAAEDEGGKGAVGALIGLVLLVAIGVAVRKFTGDDQEEEFPEEEQPDVIVN